MIWKISATATAFLAVLPVAGLAQSGLCGLFEAVEPGDTFAIIADRCGVSVETLTQANPGVNAAAPEVASVVALQLPETREVAGEPVGDGPKIVAAPESPTVVVVEPALAPDPAAAELYLVGMTGLWVEDAQACADPEFQWALGSEAMVISGDTCTIQTIGADDDAVVIEAICEADGATVARPFAFTPLDGVTLGVKTGDQAAKLTRCDG